MKLFAPSDTLDDLAPENQTRFSHHASNDRLKPGEFRSAELA